MTDWTALRSEIVRLDALAKSKPSHLAAVDAIGALVRDRLDGFGLSIWDEETLFAALVTLHIVAELAENGSRRDFLSLEELVKVRVLVQSFAAALISYVPSEARS